MRIKLGIFSGILMLGVLVSVLWTVQYQILKYSSQEREVIQGLYVNSKEDELRQYVQIAKATVVRMAITPGDPQQLQRQALALLSQMNFGNDGYFFVYDSTGRILLDPGQMQMPGVDFCEPDQPDGARQAGMLLTTARSGGGFVRYDWQKPSSKVNAPKMSYVTQVGQWGWILGAGIYLDDVNASLAQIDQLARQNIAETQRGISWIAAAAILLIGTGGMGLYLWQERSANRRLRQLGSRLVSSRDDERARVAQELHDGVMQVMVSSKYLLEAAQSQLPPAHGEAQATPLAAPPTPQSLLDMGLKRLAEAMSEMRRVAHGMRPAVLDGLSLPAALGVLIEQLQQECPFALELAQSGRPVELPPEYGTALFRITQEAVGNARKHAGPSQVRVSLHFDATRVRLRVLDDGCGFQVQQAIHGGLGLRSMRERVNHMGGRFSLHSGGYGTQIEVELPYPESTVAPTTSHACTEPHHESL